MRTLQGSPTTVQERDQFDFEEGSKRKFSNFLAAIQTQEFFAPEKTTITRVRYIRRLEHEGGTNRRAGFPVCSRKEQDGKNGYADVYWALASDLESAISNEVFSITPGDLLSSDDADRNLVEIVTFELHAGDESPAFIKIVTKMHE